MIEKKQFNASIREDISKQFKDKCKDLGIKKYSEVVEALLKAFINDELKLETEIITYKITKQ